MANNNITNIKPQVNYDNKNKSENDILNNNNNNNNKIKVESP